MVRRWLVGEFGNRIAAWPTLDAFLADKSWPASRKVAVRYLEPGAPWCCYDLYPDEVMPVVRRWVLGEGADVSKFWLNDSENPDPYIRIQGEVMRGPRGLELRWSPARKKMRIALRDDERHANGLAAKLIVDGALDPPSREWLDVLLDRYPDHVVEFSTWSIAHGDLGWNTVFWEVRKY